MFKRKEKNQIPQVGQVAQPSIGRNNSATGDILQATVGGKVKKGDIDTPVNDRRYGREAPSYNPGTTQGSYGQYGNYSGQAQQQQQYQPPYQQQQQQAGYGGNSRNELFKGARPPANSTGSAFDEYTAGSRGQAAPRAQQGGERPEWADDAGEPEPQEQANEEEDEVYVNILCFVSAVR